LSRFEEAQNSLRRALQLRPNHTPARQALEISRRQHREDAQALCESGIALWNRERFAESIAAFQAAILVEPRNARAHFCYAVALSGERYRLDEAMQSFRTAIELEPEYAEAHYGLGEILLARGELQEGWIRHEWRRYLPTSPDLHPKQRWEGQPIEGRTMVLLEEQGLGDTIQFVRYAALAAARAARVIVVCHQSLFRLMALVPGVDQVVPCGQPVKHFDFHLPMMSLPFLFKTQLETIPAIVPYIQVPTAEKARWRKRLGEGRGMKVGLVWAGNPEFQRDRERSISPALLAPLQRVQSDGGVTFYSLQKGPVSPHAAGKPPMPVIDLADELVDMADTAAVISALDLVITVDSAVAHLAGALGRPVWVLLMAPANWRWLLDRDDSPWYPTMKLFRQEKRQKWEPVMRRVARELGEVAREMVQGGEQLSATDTRFDDSL
jgi:TPR repeat/Glycosyltransferase family 9 (heptosyltransferase)